MTEDDVLHELAGLDRNDTEAAADLYRRARREGVAWPALVVALMDLHDRRDSIMETLATIDAQERLTEPEPA